MGKQEARSQLMVAGFLLLFRYKPPRVMVALNMPRLVTIRIILPVIFILH